MLIECSFFLFVERKYNDITIRVKKKQTKIDHRRKNRPLANEKYKHQELRSLLFQKLLLDTLNEVFIS